MSNTCHCGEPAVADCPCCDTRVCTTHLAQAANALAQAIGIKSVAAPTPDEPKKCMTAGCGFDAVEPPGMFCVSCTRDVGNYEREQQKRKRRRR